MTALITPFTEDGEIDFHALSALIEEQIYHGCDGFIVCGTTAETPTLSESEKSSLLDFVIQQVNGRIEVWYGCGTNSTLTTLRNAQAAQHKKITGLLLVTPYYNRPSQAGLFQHFARISQAVSCNIMLYNIPARTGCTLQEDTLDCLISKYPNIVALKQADNDYEMVKDILKKHPSFSIYSGEDGSFDEGFDAGMCGLISVMSHVVMKTLRTYVDGDRLDVSCKKWLSTCSQLTFIESSPAPMKYMLYRQGRCKNILRLPLVSISENNAQKIDTWMTENDKYIS